MKLATFDGRAAWHVGKVEGHEIVDLTVADASLTTMIDVLERGPEAVATASSSPAATAAAAVEREAWPAGAAPA